MGSTTPQEELRYPTLSALVRAEGNFGDGVRPADEGRRLCERARALGLSTARADSLATLYVIERKKRRAPVARSDGALAGAPVAVSSNRTRHEAAKEAPSSVSPATPKTHDEIQYSLVQRINERLKYVDQIEASLLHEIQGLAEKVKAWCGEERTSLKALRVEIDQRMPSS
jgi:hypothetical protein